MQAYLLARGEFRDGLNIEAGLEVELNYDATQQVGRFFSLYPQIKGAKGKDVELLILHSGKRVVPFTLMRWQGDDPESGSVVGKWNGDRLVFRDLFLTRDLPPNSQLAVLVRTQRGDNKFRLQTFPIASIAAKTALTEPVTHAVLESDPPRTKWMLKISASIGAATVRWYVTDADGRTSAEFSFAQEETTSLITILSKPHRTWEDNHCKVLVVRFDAPNRQQGAPLNSPAWRPNLNGWQSRAVAAPFGTCN